MGQGLPTCNHQVCQDGKDGGPFCDFTTTDQISARHWCSQSEDVVNLVPPLTARRYLEQHAVLSEKKLFQQESGEEFAGSAVSTAGLGSAREEEEEEEEKDTPADETQGGVDTEDQPAARRSTFLTEQWPRAPMSNFRACCALSAGRHSTSESGGTVGGSSNLGAPSSREGTERSSGMNSTCSPGQGPGYENLQKKLPLMLPSQKKGFRPEGRSRPKASKYESLDERPLKPLLEPVPSGPGSPVGLEDPLYWDILSRWAGTPSGSSESEDEEPSPRSGYIRLQQSLPLMLPPQNIGQRISWSASNAAEICDAQDDSDAELDSPRRSALKRQQSGHAQGGSLPTLLPNPNNGAGAGGYSGKAGSAKLSQGASTNRPPSSEAGCSGKSKSTMLASEQSGLGGHLADKVREERQMRERLRMFLLSNGYRGICSKKKGLLTYTYPLHTAVRQNDSEMVKALLFAKADYEQRDSTGRTPLQLAMSKDNGLGSHEAVLAVLLASGAGRFLGVAGNAAQQSIHGHNHNNNNNSSSSSSCSSTNNHQNQQLQQQGPSQEKSQNQGQNQNQSQYNIATSASATSFGWAGPATPATTVTTPTTAASSYPATPLSPRRSNWSSCEGTTRR